MNSRNETTWTHPITGVVLNTITERRPALTEAEVETARHLLDAGEPIHIAAAMLGTNQGRISEALPGHARVRDLRQGDLF
jgi:hypothetical protein